MSSRTAKRRRQIGPVIVGILFLLLACGISVDFFFSHYSGVAGLETEAQRLETPEQQGLRQPSSIDPMEEEMSVVRDRTSPQKEISLDVKEADYKISLSRSSWKGEAQLLPNPMYISMIRETGGRDIRGGGWVAIDIAKSQIVPVELYKGKQTIEVKRIGSNEVVTPSNTGFPIVRGISDLQPGRFEVFENPPCLVRFGGVVDDEICEIALRTRRLRYKFEPPAIPLGAYRPDFVMSNVYVEFGPDRWVRIGSFNENFYPIGDANRDGYPDFYAESVTNDDQSGTHTLLISRVSTDAIEYFSTTARFRNGR